MSIAERLREIYNECKHMNSEQALDIILEAQDEGEADFFMAFTDYMQQHKEKILEEEIAEKEEQEGKDESLLSDSPPPPVPEALSEPEFEKKEEKA